MEFNYWVCDVCGRKFEKNDAGYENKHPINIVFFDTPFGFTDETIYQDTCISCRRKIAESIDETIRNIQKDC